MAQETDYSAELEYFSPVGATTYPYLPEPRLIDGFYHLYEGAIGQDRYQYFQVPELSGGGRAIAAFVDRYYVQQAHHVEYYKEGAEMLELAKRDSILQLDGWPAYERYWKEFLTTIDQVQLNFYIIPFFEPLMEWFVLRQVRQVNQAGTATSAAVNHKRWLRKVEKEVSDFLEASKSTPLRDFSMISLNHAHELLRFRDWLRTFLDAGVLAPTLTDFIIDFAAKDRSLVKSGTADKGDIAISYVLNNRRYSIIQFWILLKDYHINKIQEVSGREEQLTYLERIIPQLRIASNADYERFILEYNVPTTIADEVSIHAERVIKDVEHRVQDIKRYFREQENRKPAKEGSTENKEQQVPWIGNLLQLSIPDTILDVFYSMVSQPRNISEVPNGYVGNIRHFSQPFVGVTGGAYVLRSFWDLLLIKIQDGYFENKGISKDVIEQYLRAYSEGFILGYNRFDGDYMKEELGVFQEPADIEEFVYRQVSDIFSSHGNFSETTGDGKHLLSNWQNDGKEGGYFYRAWHMILQHWQRFLPKFTSSEKPDGSVHHNLPLLEAATGDKIMEAISHAGEMALNSKRLYSGKSEDEIRDLFVYGLSNSNLGPLTVTGETYNHGGKTDICFTRTNNVRVFVGECKIWRGSGNMLKAIEQLIDRYVHWTLTRSAVLLFVTQPNFTKTYQSIITNIAKSIYFVEYLPAKSERHIVAIFRQATDAQRLVQVEIIAFPFPETVSSDDSL